MELLPSDLLDRNTCSLLSYSLDELTYALLWIAREISLVRVGSLSFSRRPLTEAEHRFRSPSCSQAPTHRSPPSFSSPQLRRILHCLQESALRLRKRGKDDQKLTASRFALFRARPLGESSRQTP